MIWVEISIDQVGFKIKSPKGGEILIIHSMVEKIPDRKLKEMFNLLSKLFHKGSLKKNENKSESQISISEMKSLYKLSKHDIIIQ